MTIRSLTIRKNVFQSFRRRSRVAHNRARLYRPLIEQLECASCWPSICRSRPTRRPASGLLPPGNDHIHRHRQWANVSVTDIDTALHAGNDVVVTSGTAGFEAGNISTSGFTTHVFNNQAGTTLTISTGSGLWALSAERASRVCSS